jgi:DNA invertase Pin-like site-specific DNA recombinase
MSTATIATDLTSDYADVSDPAGEPIAVWERVSTDMTRQDIASQTRDLKAYIGAGSYRVARVFRFEASAFHGKHAPQQAAMLADIEADLYKTVVSAMTSRYERRGWQHAMYFGLQLHFAGARVVAIDDPAYGDMSNVMGGFSTMMKAQSNHDYSKAISENVSRKFRKMDDAGKFRGDPPAGYAVECEICGRLGCKDKTHAGKKRLVPAPARRDVQRTRTDRKASAAAGERVTVTTAVTLPSADDIRQAFKDAPTTSTVKLGKRLGMTPDGVAKILRSKVYSTGAYPVKRHDGVTAIHKCEPLVTPAQQQRAVQALADRRTGDNVISRGLAEDDFSGALWCGNPECGLATMHRYYSGNRKRNDGTAGPRVRRYVCRVCHKSVHADKADAAVSAFMSSRTVEWLQPTWVDGNDHQAELDRVALELSELPKRGLDDDTEDSERARLRAERRRLEALPRESGRWEFAFSGISEGDRWAGMPVSDQRAWLNSGEFRMYCKPAPGRSGNVVVERVYLPNELD